MMAPTIALREDQPVLVTGSGGSNRIRSAIVQVLVNVLCRRMTLEEAIHSPRVHCDGETIHAEAGFPLDELAHRRLNEWLGRSLFFGGTHSVTPETAVGDPRRSGCALEFD
jgi:gamma-glutamyltranspeptidase/glutathione hydrolase